MFCVKCGREIADGKKFCPYCGAKIAGGAAPTVNMPRSAAPRAPKQPFRINKALVLSLIEIVIIAALGFAVFKFGNYMYGARNAAKGFMKAVAEEDWDTVYGLVDTGDSEYLTKDTVKEIIKCMFPDEFDDYEISDSSSDDSEEVKVRYGQNGSLKNKATLIMSEQSEKQFLIFTTWKVSVDDELVKKFVVYAPQGTDAYFDGVKLSRDLIDSGYTPSQDYGSDISYDAYVIKETYKGKHTAAAAIDKNVIAVDNIDLSAGDPDASGYNEAVLSSAFATKGLQDELIQLAYDDMTKIISAKINGEKFDVVKDLYTGKKDDLGNDNNRYESTLSTYCKGNVDGSGITDLELNNISGLINNFSFYNNTLNASVAVNFTYSGTTLEQDYWSGDKTEQNLDGYSSYYNVNFVLDENGEWKIMSDELGYQL